MSVNVRCVFSDAEQVRSAGAVSGEEPQHHETLRVQLIITQHRPGQEFTARRRAFYLITSHVCWQYRL